MTAPVGLRSALCIRLGELGIRDAEEQRHIFRVWARRPLASRTEIGEEEAHGLLRRLRTMTEAEARAVLALPAPTPPPAEEPAEEPADVGDQGDVRGRLRLDGIDPGCPQPEYRYSLADAPAGEPDPGDPSTWSDDDWTADAEGTGPLSDVPHENEDPPPAPAPCEPPRRTPEEIEAAAEDAVRRFRERQAAGWVPTPPPLSSIPPRVPQVLPPNPQRSCPPALCWCGTCPHWKPAPPVDYSKVEGTKAWNEKHRGTWDNRTRTWIDGL